MITGIQITQTHSPLLLNSFWLLDEEAGQARCLCARGLYEEDQVVALSELGEMAYREVPLEPKSIRSCPFAYPVMPCGLTP